MRWYQNSTSGGSSKQPLKNLSYSVTRYLEQVENRLADVEEEVSRLKRLLPSSFPHEKQHVLFPRSISGHTGGLSEATHPEESLNVEDGSITQGITPDATDGVGTIEFTTDETWAYFGPSSNIAFTRIIRRTLDHLLHKTQRDEQGGTSSTPTSHAQQHILAVSRSRSPVTDSFDIRKLEKPSEASRLPPEEEVVSLVRQFFRDTGLLFPYIHEESFWKAYAHYRAGGMQNAKIAWRALLHMILAMATSTMNASGVGLGDRQAMSEVYYRRAKALFMTDMMTGANVEAVQAMLLMSQYLQGSQRSIQTWAIHGLAVKAALELGFQSELALQRFDPLEREIRIRTWYGCVVLDRTLYGVTAAVIDDLYESNIGSISTIPLTNTVAKTGAYNLSTGAPSHLKKSPRSNRPGILAEQCACALRKLSSAWLKLANSQTMYSLLSPFLEHGAFNASLTIVATKLVEDKYVSMPFDQGYTSTAIRLDEILKNAVSCIARLDIQNPMVEKCAKFTATLIFMVQSLQMIPGREDASREVRDMLPSHTIPSDEGNNTQATQIPSNAGTDEAFSNLMNHFPPNFNDFPNTSANFSMSELMDDFATGDLFW
ncbi:fungal specific transcription factor domain-containing protein [Colletotrichum orchidophilum]|uniref:Fungal specific transcription factor domain-containing protein n=1 Tax=Colletotrichum orchidophilum TaxID=1209926 RepID=A0A1G4BE99_9PEZI|nr:fungal specific transcription factor domain-containing protein [Colletotrichum orchidophilum]OHE99662.1 fungal specific transcription factor domain-containing protein [Colletotrichum orchidophilum]